MSRIEWIGAALPSGESANDLVRGKPGALPRVVSHTALRAGLVGVGMSIAGLTLKQGLIKYALAGALGIEAFVLVWAYANKDRDE